MIWCDINKTVINKDVDNWFQFNNTFQTQRLTVKELINEICSGHAYTTVHSKDNNETATARHADNFMFAQHFGLDFDDTVDGFVPTVRNVSNIPVVKEYASFVHSTASSTEEAPRSRAVFIIDDGIRDMQLYTDAVSFVNMLVGVTDTACTDAVRVFFGATNAEVREIGNTVPTETFMSWASRWQASRKRVLEESVGDGDTGKLVQPSSYTTYVENAIVSEVSILANEAQGNRHIQLLKSASSLASMMKSSWCPAGMLTSNSISGMLLAACHDNGLFAEDGQRAILKTIEDGIANATPRSIPVTKDERVAMDAHSSLPMSLDITKVSEMDRVYSAYMAGKVAQSMWEDISEQTIKDLGIVFTKDSVVVPFIDSGKLADIAKKVDGGYEFNVGVDTVSSPAQPNSDGKIAIVTKNPEDIAVLFDRLTKYKTPYQVFGTSEIGKGVANRLQNDYDEVIFLTYDSDENIEVARKAVKNSGLITLQGTMRELYSWGLNNETLSNMLSQAW